MRKTKLTIFLAAISLAFFGGAGAASAAEYYVSPTGSVAWENCSGATPLNGASACSWQTAMANAVAGDMVYFRGGIYDLGIFGNYPSMAYYTKMYPANSGTAAQPITFKAYSGESPDITGTITSTSQEAWFGCGGRDYITWDGFSATLKINNVNPDAHYETALFLARGNYCTLRNSQFTGADSGDWPYNTSFVRVEGSSYALIENNYFHDQQGTTNAVNSTGIWLFTSDHTTVRNNTFYHTRGGVYGKTGVSSADIYNNFIYNPENNEAQDGIALLYQGGSTTVGFNIYQNVIIGCTRGVRLVGILGTINNARIYNNTISNGNGVQAGIFISSGVVNVEVFNNIINGAVPLLRYYTTSSYSYSDNNMLYHPSSFVGNLNYTTNYTSLSSWQIATALDTYSTTTNPLFVTGNGASPTDYKLQSTSPAHTGGRGGSYSAVRGAYITGDEIIGYVAPTQADTTPPSAPTGLVVM